MAEEITTENIVDAALAPQTVIADGVTVNARPIADVIAADKHATKKAAARKRGRGIGFIKLISEGPA
jgi:hypothetical protein